MIHKKNKLTKFKFKKIQKYLNLIIIGRFYLFIKYFFFNKNIELKNTLSSEETVDFILNNKKSLIRWGDGESGVFFCRSIYFQNYNRELSKKLEKIVVQYSRESNYLLAIPVNEIQRAKTLFQGENKGKYELWKSTRFLFGNHFDRRNLYGDAMLGRVLNMEILQKLWMESKKLIIVCNDRQVYEKFRRNYVNKDIYFVQIARINAFQEYPKILEKIFALIDSNKLPDKNELKILISAGPTAKVLVYDLSSLGYMTYDLGIVLERYLSL